jgi:hypothetical protein
LHQFKSDPLGTFEELEPPADVVHLVAEHLHPVGQEVAGGRADIVDAECKVIVAPPTEICRVLTYIGRWHWFEFEQLDLEARLGSFEYKRDVASLHIRHAHISRRRTIIDHCDVLLPEAQNFEEFDCGRSIRHRDGYMVGIAK